MKKIKFVVIILSFFGFSYKINSCPANTEQKQAKNIEVDGKMVLHCDMAGNSSCCKTESKEPKSLF
jgi:hypothetical protein